MGLGLPLRTMKVTTEGVTQRPAALPATCPDSSRRAWISGGCGRYCGDMIRRRRGLPTRWEVGCQPAVNVPWAAAGRARLAPHFTDLDGPVFALVNLAETVKGALFARYSRYPGTLRRLFLDEFAGDLPQGADAQAEHEGADGARAAQLYERIFLGYGDDSVAQLGGAHVACER